MTIVTLNEKPRADTFIVTIKDDEAFRLIERYYPVLAARIKNGGDMFRADVLLCRDTFYANHFRWGEHFTIDKVGV